MLPDFQLEIFLSRWEFAARHNLAASDAQTLTIGELLAYGDREAFEALPLSYAPTWGTPELLEAISATYDVVRPEHVLVFAGAEEALFWALARSAGSGCSATRSTAGLRRRRSPRPPTSPSARCR